MQPELFDDHPALSKPQRPAAYALPPIPNTGWKAPTTFPRLEGAKAVAIDLETFDPDLLTHGPGWGRGVGHIVGIAVGTDDGHRWYFPMRHTVGEGNLPPEAVLQWARDEFGRAHQDKVFANAQYDLGWLRQEGVDVAGNIIDVQIAEPLLDEHAHSYSLDTLAQKYLGEGKVDDALYAWCQRAYGGKEGRPQACNIWRAPPCLVGPYAEGDVDLPLRIWQKQKPLLEEQGLMGLYKIEAVLPRILVGMRMKGVRVDVEGAERVKERLANSSKTAQERIRQLSGVQVDIWAAQSIARALDKCRIEYPKTKNGTPSFESAWLDRHPSEITSLIRDARKYDKAAATFINGYILDKQINSRLYGQFHQLRGEDGGTVVGRFSSCLPDTTIITTHRGDVPLSDVQIGDLVWTHKQQWRAVKNKWFTSSSKTYKIALQNGRKVTCTSNHRLLTKAGWLSLEDIRNEFMQKGFTQPTKAQGSISSVSIGGQTDGKADGGDLQYIISNGIADIAGMHTRYSVQAGKGTTILPQQSGGHAPYEGEVSRGTSQLQRDNIGRKGLFDGIAPSMVHWWREAQACFSASCDYVRSVARNRTPTQFCGASHQWGQDGQSYIESCIAIGYGARGTPPSYSTIKSVEYVGITPVYDLEIETDHCFLADGIFVHNSLPNLENIPSRDEEIGPMIRSLFLPEDGCDWEVADFSQIQFRLMVSYGIGASADDARAKYNDDPTTDFHDMAQALIHTTTGVWLDRKPVKNINFAVAFTGGASTVADQMGIPLEKAKEFVEQYNLGLPFIKSTSAKVAQVAAQRGFIRDVVGRRHRFPFWEPRDWNLRGKVKMSQDRETVDKAITEQIEAAKHEASQGDRKGKMPYTGSVRAMCHLGLNRLAQSGEGAQMKKALVDSYNDGVFDVIGHLNNIVHDDISYNNPHTPEGDEAIKQLHHNMQNCLKWRVPILVSKTSGPTWGEQS